MFNRKMNQRSQRISASRQAAARFGMEMLEERRLLSASVSLPPQPYVLAFGSAPQRVRRALRGDVPANKHIGLAYNLFVQPAATPHGPDYNLQLFQYNRITKIDTSTRITVHANGDLVDDDIQTTIQFSYAPTVVQAGLQALASAGGVTIPATQGVTIYPLKHHGPEYDVAMGVYLGGSIVDENYAVNANGDPISSS
jgi:hypothetical protein